MRPSAPTVAAQLPVGRTVKHENQMAGGDHRPQRLIVIGPLVFLTAMKRIARDAGVAEQPPVEEVGDRIGDRSGQT
jgi:hypothetical protein